MKMNPKPAGPGILTAYTVIIGSREARESGLIGCELEKKIEPGKITITRKENGK